MRTELGSWLSGLGEAALAAAALRGIELKKPVDQARNLLKIAVLLGRAGDALGAADALREAAGLEHGDAMAHELLGMLASWSDDVSPEEAASAYGEAAEHRIKAGEEDAAFEDRLRAFEIAPGHEPSARSLAAAVAERSSAAADEVLRAHAAAVGLTDAAQALAIHRERMRTAAAEGDFGRATGALLDAWLEGDVGGEHAEEADAVLLSAGLGEMVAARLAVYAEEREGEARSAGYLSLGKLLAGSLASADRAAEAYAEAFVADPRATEALQAGVMLAFSGPVSDFVHRHPTMKMLALAFLILIGVMLVAEGFGQHIDRGYIYFAMAFSLGVELLNMRLQKGRRPIELRDSVLP